MGAGPLSLRGSDGRRAWVGAALLLALLAIAYRALVGGSVALPSHAEVEGWLFRPSQLPAALVVAAACWMLWRRRARLLALPADGAPLLAVGLLLPGGALFVWAHLTGAADLLLPALSLQLLALAAATRGARGVRALAAPACVLLLGLRIPAPLQDEIVWRLQLWTAASAAWLVGALGGSLSHAGVMLRTPDHSFHVIDGCSGLRGIMILTLVALIVRELFAGAGRRSWLLLASAPALGFALNVVRVAYVATSDDPEALAGMGGDHTPQGLAVLGAGTALLYALGLALGHGRGGETRQVAAAPVSPRSWALAAGWLALLAAISVGVTPRAAETARSPEPANPLPEQAADWTSEPLVGDPLFFGEGRQRLHRRYLPAAPVARGDDHAVEVFVGVDDAAQGDTSMLSAKIAWPGPDWDVERSEPVTLWMLQREGRLTIAARPPSSLRAVVYTWRSGDLGLWRESWRSLLALDASPLRRERPRRVVRLIAFAPHDGDLVLDRARQRLDQFVTRFRSELGSF